MSREQHPKPTSALGDSVTLHPAYRNDIGDLVTRRPLPGPGLDRLGAFLFLNHHGPQVYPPHNDGLPFGPHPHRGFETVTFVLDGELAHRDSAGHESVIGAGGVQWMIAGRGIVHEELAPASFRRDGGPLELLQLWVNLPARLKMVQPTYLGLQKSEIPRFVVDDGRVRVKLIAGEFGSISGAVQSLTGVFLATVKAQPGGRVRFDGTASRDVLLYCVSGAIEIGGRAIPACSLVEVGRTPFVEIAATAESVILFGHADPIDEPVVARGPFVMTTEREIDEAFADYNAGRLSPALAAS